MTKQVRFTAETRLEKQTNLGFKHLQAFVPEKYDLVLTKIGRADENDLRGIARIHASSELDPEILVDRFCSEMTHANTPMRKLCVNLLFVIFGLFGSEIGGKAEKKLKLKFPEAFV